MDYVVSGKIFVVRAARGENEAFTKEAGSFIEYMCRLPPES